MTYLDALESHARRRIQVELGVSPLVVDADGDYVWGSDDGPLVCLRLQAPTRVLQVWCCAATDVPGTAAVLRELNAWNVATPYVRAIWDRREVVVVVDISLESLAPGHLTQLAGIVARAGSGLGDALAVTVGARRPWLTPMPVRQGAQEASGD